MTHKTASGLIAHYEIRHDDGTTVEVRTGIPDVLRWEAQNPGRSAIGLQTATAIFEIVYYSLRRQALTEIRLFDQWVATVADIYSIQDADEADDEDSDEADDPTEGGPVS